MPPPADLDLQLKTLILKDLREQLRARGQNPGGGIEELRQRLKEHMVSSGDYRLNVTAPCGGAAPANGAATLGEYGGGNTGGNNYSRPSGMQNVGNFISDRPTSRVLAPPGGGSQITFGGDDAPTPVKPQPVQSKSGTPVPAAPTNKSSTHTSSSSVYGSGYKEELEGHLKNNYSRPSGMQNVGNFVTDRPSSKVLAPPGGKSQISFG